MKKRRRREEADSISAVHPRCDTLMDPWCSASLLPVPWVLWVVGKHMHRFTLLPDSRRFFAPPWPLRAPSYVGQSFSLLFQSFTFLNVFLCVCWVLCSYSQISHCLSFSISSPPHLPPPSPLALSERVITLYCVFGSYALNTPLGAERGAWARFPFGCSGVP